ncbi:MAG: hypothetical protein JWO08_3708 [Verrucomicrobiaceae bacterium]|nr:hypothetical protein [Verrucomicrobiaceae bacterium]
MTIAMKSRPILCLGAGALLTLSSCYTWRPPGPPPPPRRGASLDMPPRENTRYMGGPEEGPSPLDTPIPGEIQPPSPQPSEPPPITDSPPTPGPSAELPLAQETTPKPSSSSNGLPFGIKVPNKPGFVYSPYDKTAGIVDVTGFATGTKVKCPYTSKVFLVP